MKKTLLIKNSCGFTLVEVIISSVIFSIAAVGLFSTFTAMREASARSERRLQAAYYEKQLLEDLRAKVDQGIWGSGAAPLWGPGGEMNCDVTWRNWPAGWMGAPNPLFAAPYSATVQYRCTQIPGGGPGAFSRQVELRMIWTEPHNP